MSDKRLPAVYLDMNVLGMVAEGSLSLPPAGYRYVYSSEHFTELSRGNADFLLDHLAAIGAYELSPTLNSRWQITDAASLSIHPDIRGRYRDHLRMAAQGKRHIEMFQSIAASMWGADNLEAVVRAVADLPSTILPSDLIDNGADLVAEASRVSEELRSVLESTKDKRQTLAKQRKALGANRAQPDGLPPEQVIPEIWRRISPRLPGATMEQFFGADPLYPGADEPCPVFLAAVRCHSMLNAVGYRPDKGLANENHTANILSDGSHIAHATYCDILLTADRRLSAKASVIYAFLRAKTTVGLVTGNQA